MPPSDQSIDSGIGPVTMSISLAELAAPILATQGNWTVFQLAGKFWPNYGPPVRVHKWTVLG